MEGEPRPGGVREMVPAARPGPPLPPASGLAPTGGQKMEPRCQGGERQPRQVAANRARLPAAARQNGR